jgi:hypothetical protein
LTIWREPLRGLGGLKEDKLLPDGRWQNGGCEVLDLDGLCRLAKWSGLSETTRPLV